MTSDFIEKLEEILETEEIELTEETELSSLVEYDSLAVMSIIALVDEYFGKKLTSDQLDRITTVKSLMNIIGLEYFE